MNIDFTGRHVEITPALRDFAEEKLSKLERLLDGPLDAHVILSIEKHRHMAEILVKSRHAVLSGQEETGDLYASIGEVVDKLERQALKHKEKIIGKKHRKGPKFGEAAAELEERARAAMEASSPATTASRIVRTERHQTKPLAPEDAVLELETSGERLLVFRDARTNHVSVVYRLDGEDFGLVETDF